LNAARAKKTNGCERGSCERIGGSNILAKYAQQIGIESENDVLVNIVSGPVADNTTHGTYNDRCSMPQFSKAVVLDAF